MQVDTAPKIDVDAYVSGLYSTVPPELQALVESFGKLHHRKLWHQLTQAVSEFIDHSASKPFRVDVFTLFVREFESHINQLTLVQMGAKVSREFEDPTTHLNFLTSLLSRINKTESPEAYVLVLSTLAHAKLLYGDLLGTKTDIDEAGKTLDDLDSVDTSVNAAYYSVSADYYKARAEYAPYYKNSLLYLACIDVNVDLTPAERLQRAHDLGVSAFLGDTIYNFGELLMHPILDSLDNTEYDWIKKLLFTFNEGNIGKFESLAPLFPKEPILQENYPFLRQKICLMALIESVFKRPAEDRTMTFEAIAHETRLPVDEVEHLLMKALSLKLIRGSIDQVDEKASITWVQPRVLSRPQIGQLADRLTAWCDKLNKLEGFVSQTTPELFANA
ncbi:hypothetical protein M422DRAFT_59530 [Sphaerobolus stellatus SS14]|nr:hypothetical protein M422DRAFT_59530 [Sphaerobolus stellatus SS14]